MTKKGDDNLRDRLSRALPAAMKARDRPAMTALRSAVAAIDNAGAVDPTHAPPTGQHPRIVTSAARPQASPGPGSRPPGVRRQRNPARGGHRHRFPPPEVHCSWVAAPLQWCWDPVLGVAWSWGWTVGVHGSWGRALGPRRCAGCAPGARRYGRGRWRDRGRAAQSQPGTDGRDRPGRDRRSRDRRGRVRTRRPA
jgi:hypothetical protein